MVFIELKSTYLSQYRATPGIANVINYIFEQKNNVQQEQDANSAEFAVNSLIVSILSNNAESFLQIEDTYKRKQPDVNSPWINNSYLIFLLLIGLKKFNRNNNWLRSAINLRKRGDDEAGFLFDFFSSILSNNFWQNGKSAPLFLSFNYLADTGLITSAMLNEGIKELKAVPTFPYFQSEFLNILYLSAFDVSLTLKDMIDINLKEKIEKFRIYSSTKIKIVSACIVYFILILLIVVVFLFVKYIFVNFTESTRNTIVTLVGIFGLTALEILRGRSVIKKKIENKIRKFLGYEILD